VKSSLWYLILKVNIDYRRRVPALSPVLLSIAALAFWAIWRVPLRSGGTPT